MGPRKKSKQQAKKEVQKTSAKKAEDEADPSISDEIPHNSSISPEASGNKQATESNVSLVAPVSHIGWSDFPNANAIVPASVCTWLVGGNVVEEINPLY